MILIRESEFDMEKRKLTKEDLDKVRHIEGFPIGKDEDIIALSDPPYYTACPNPFIADFIKEHGTPYDEATDDYHREPFASDVSEGKSGDIYNYHTYHTKVPPAAILKYILHYTKPGDVIYDAFAGSGMTGVAAAMANEPNWTNNDTNAGKRYSVLCDISPAASFIMQGYNRVSKLSDALPIIDKMLNQLKDEFGWAYETNHSIGKGIINYTVWSDLLICPHCGNEICYYDVNIDKETGHKKGNSTTCSSCGFTSKISEFEKSTTMIFDEVSGKPLRMPKEKPVLINYTYDGKKYNKIPDENDLNIIDKIAKTPLTLEFPKSEIPDGFNTSQPKKSHLIERMDLFYNKRSLIVYSWLWDKAEKLDIPYRNAVKFWLQTVSVGFTKTNRYFSSSFSQVNRYLKGTLYVAQIRSEVSPWYALTGKAKKLSKLISNPDCIITCMSSGKSLLPDNSIDYMFVDPPFGANIMYSDLNIIWESWLKVHTNQSNEAIINDVAGKDGNFYKQVMLKVMKDCYRVLKPNRWLTVEFHNSQNEVWNILQSVIGQAGFVIADVRVLDKKVQTMKQYSTSNSVDKDLVISAYKPKNSFTTTFTQNAGTEETAWAFVRQHLANLPVVVKSSGKIEIVAERQAFLLFDRMVAYHIMQGLPVPVDAADFYKGLDDRFLKRDSMYFLPDQVTEYDLARSSMELEKADIALFVTDEKSAIGWLYVQLDEKNGGKRQTYQVLQPKFMQEVRTVKRTEKMPELITMLEENFLEDDSGAWYVPDLAKSGDVAKLREKNLLKEFQEYQATKGKLKVFRSEAIRVGFAKLWKDKEYKAIVALAERLPEETVQEDPNILMYYDISLSRV